MGTYRQTRNIEASVIDYIRSQMTGSWSNIEIAKTWDSVRDFSLPVVLVRCGTTLHNPVEAGSHATWREPIVLIDIFAPNDGLRLDLKDYLIDILRGGCPYYLYEIENGSVKNKTLSGRLRVTNIDDDPINFDIDKNNIDIYERYRHLITLTVATGKVEN